MAPDLTLDLVRHMKARNRRKWAGDDDERPLTKRGLRQAEAHVDPMLAGEPIVGVYSSPALRCRQTVQPLADRLGLEVRIEPLLAETRRLAVLPAGAESPLLTSLRTDHPEGGRLVACSHADTIPAFLASLGVEMPFALPAVLEGFGGWYRVRAGSDALAIEALPVPEGFPADS